VWDTAGQERFHSVTIAYYRGASGILLIFDLTRRSSFEHVGFWLDQARKHAPPGIPIVIVGNKSDLEEQREVTHEEGQQAARGLGAGYAECSALLGQGIDESFGQLLEPMIAARPIKPKAAPPPPAILEPEEPTAECC
jgi:small GTP-binding protein